MNNGSGNGLFFSKFPKIFPSQTKQIKCHFKTSHINSPSFFDSLILPNSSKKIKGTIKKKSIATTDPSIRKSELLSILIFSQNKFVRKCIFTLKTFFFVHMLAALLNFLIMVIQSYYDEFCFLSPFCECSNKFGVKIYILVKCFFSVWILQISLFYNSFFFTDELAKKTWLKFLFISVLLIDISFFHLYENGDSQNHQLFLKIYIIGFCVCLCLYFFTFALLGFTINEWFQKYFKGSLVNVLFFLNYSLMRCFFNLLPPLLRYYFSENMTESLIFLIIAIYSTTLKSIIQKFCWIYCETLLKYSKNKAINDLRMALQIRFSCCYYVAINTVVLLRMKPESWGGWVLIFDYVVFLIKSYSNWDVYEFLSEKIIFKYCLDRKKNKKSKDFIEFQKLFCGCCLDLQLICIIRLFIMYFWKRWSFGPGITIFYENCKFDISDKFEMNLWAIIVIFSVNCIIIFGMFSYMNARKIVLFFYKTTLSKTFNVMLFFSLHFYLENQIQSFTVIFFDYNFDYFN